MTLEQLKHAIRAACDVSNDFEVLIIGSQAILGEHPDPHPDLNASIEVDIQPKNKLDAIDIVEGTLGELSIFHDTHGFYVQGVIIAETACLPYGWEDRMVIVRDESTMGNTGYCLESHDLAASKIKAHRDKDRSFVRTLIYEEMICTEILKKRINIMPITVEEKLRLTSWVDATNLE